MTIPQTLRNTVSVLSMFALLAVAAAAQQTARGTWTAELKKDDPGRIYVKMSREGREMNMDNTMNVSDFKGLDLASVQAANHPAKFQLVRDAGTISFDGSFNQGLGHGEFNFTANGDYISGMKQMGFGDVSNKTFELTAIDVSRDYAKQLQALGYKPDLNELISAKIFNVNREQIEGLKSVGATDLTLKRLVEYRIFKVTPEYVREMRASFPNIDMDKMVAMRIHKATPEFAKEMAQLGYSKLGADDLVAFRIHRVTPQFIREMRDLGFKDLSADQLIAFRIHGVGPEQIQDLAKAGYTGLSADKLVAFRIHHVDSAFIERVKRAGYAHPSPDELIQFKMMGIRQRDL